MMRVFNGLTRWWAAGLLAAAAVAGAGLALESPARASSQKAYVGSETCMQCHETEYENYSKYAKKASSYGSIEKMKKGLTAAEIETCYTCHTTGYGKPGGFVSAETTAHLKNAGCEVCHGPGSVHAESEDPEDIVADVSMESCLACHNSERVENFKFKPLLHGGAH
jgi:hypothetical protein